MSRLSLVLPAGPPSRSSQLGNHAPQHGTGQQQTFGLAAAIGFPTVSSAAANFAVMQPVAGNVPYASHRLPVYGSAPAGYGNVLTSHEYGSILSATEYGSISLSGVGYTPISPPMTNRYGTVTLTSANGFVSKATSTTGYGCMSTAAGYGYFSSAAPPGYGSVSAPVGYGTLSAQTGYGTVSATPGYGILSATPGYSPVSTTTGSASMSASFGFGSLSSPLGHGSVPTQAVFGSSLDPKEAVTPISPPITIRLVF